jgi:hypothetical protein
MDKSSCAFEGVTGSGVLGETPRRTANKSISASYNRSWSQPGNAQK